MKSWSFPTVLLLAIIAASAVPAHEIDAVLAKEEKRQVSLSTGASTTSRASVSQSVTTLPDTTTTVAQSSIVTSPGSVVTESSTIIQSPSVTSATTVVLSTVTRTSTNAQGQATTVPETVSSTATSAYTFSYSQVITSSTSQVVQTYTEVTGGSTVTRSRTTNTVIQVTSSARITPSALAQAEGNTSSGLSSKSKSIIGGVVGGLGGALLIGGLAYTAWRMYGKKKNLHDDDLYDPNANAEKNNAATDAQPFRSTLDQYHNPGPVNPASNF